MKPIIITDDPSTIIDKNDIDKKVQKLAMYLKKVDTRLGQLNNELAKMSMQGNEQELTAGLDYYHLQNNISRNI